jgi:hypothetical protein
MAEKAGKSGGCSQRVFMDSICIEGRTQLVDMLRVSPRSQTSSESLLFSIAMLLWVAYESKTQIADDAVTQLLMLMLWLRNRCAIVW